jgi:uncharacterized cupin superfamily protein
MTRKIDSRLALNVSGARYPRPLHLACAGRTRVRLSDVAGLSQFGVNLTTLQPGAWSSQRHWHSAEDEFIFIVKGSVVLVTDDGEETLVAGDCAGFPAGEANGHHLQNRTDEPAAFLEVGARRPQSDTTTYSDVDLLMPPGRSGFITKLGERYPDTAFDTPATAPPRASGK